MSEMSEVHMRLCCVVCLVTCDPDDQNDIPQDGIVVVNGMSVCKEHLRDVLFEGATGSLLTKLHKKRKRMRRSSRASR